MNILQIIGIALTSALLSVILKSYKPEFSVGVVVAFGAIVLVYICKSVETVFEGIRSICNHVGVKTVYIEIMFKIIGISYLCEFISSVCKDAGESAMAGKVELCGKILICVTAMPMVTELFYVIADIL